MIGAADDSAATPRDEQPPSLQDAGWLVLICGIALLVRLPFLDMPMIADVGGYAYATRGWLYGAGELYGDLWISRPQGIFLLYAVIFETLGTGTVAFRLAAWMSVCGTAIAVWAIARRWRPAPQAAVAALIFVVVSGAPSLEGYTANAEMFMMLPAAWSVWTLLNATERSWHPGWLVATGVLIGLATLLKPSGFVMYGVTLVMITVLLRKQSWNQWLRANGWVALGLALIGVPTLIHGWYLGWSDFIYATVTYRLTSQSSANVALGEHLAAIGRLMLRIWALLALMSVLLIVVHRRDIVSRFWKLILRIPDHRAQALARQLRRLVRRTPSQTTFRHFAVPDDRIGMILRLWIIASLFGIATSGDWWAHYLIQITAPFSIWFAGLVIAAIRSVRSHARVALLTLTVASLLVPYWVVSLGSTERMSNELFSHPGYETQDEIAEWLDEHTPPGATIYVAFDQAAIYYLADRPSAYRHLYDQELRAIPGSYSDIITIIRGPDRPLYIVSTRQPGPFADESRAFWQEVGSYYELETMIEEIPIYKARDFNQSAPAS